jgi:Fic family protein
MRSRYVDIDDRMDDLAERMRRAPDLAEEFQRVWDLSWLYHENALEGAVYSGQELETALANAPVADATFISSLRDIKNHVIALGLVREEAKQKKPKLNLALVKKLYETLGAGIESRAVAEFRKEMPLHRAYFHEIAQPAKIPAALQKVLDGTETADWKNAHPVQRATRFQHAFMQVFPFTENSGRVARLVSNLVLLHAGYVLPVVIHATDRQRYYESFKLTETTLRDLHLDALENGLGHAEKWFSEAMARRKAARKIS